MKWHATFEAMAGTWAIEKMAKKSTKALPKYRFTLHLHFYIS